MTALNFEALVAVDGATVTEVWRDAHGIHIEYALGPPVTTGAAGTPSGESEDDVGNRFDDVGGAISPLHPGDRIDGVLTLPLPPPVARELRASIQWFSGQAQRTVLGIAIPEHVALMERAPEPAAPSFAPEALYDMMVRCPACGREGVGGEATQRPDGTLVIACAACGHERRLPGFGKGAADAE